LDGCGWRREPGHGPAPFEGELELLRRAVAERAVGPLAVVLLTPRCQSLGGHPKAAIRYQLKTGHREVLRHIW